VLLPAMHRSSRPKWTKNQLRNTGVKPCLKSKACDIFRTFCLRAADPDFLPSAHGDFSRMDHILGPGSTYFLNGILYFFWTEMRSYTNRWKLNNTLFKFFCSARIWTQCLARQVFHHLSQAPSPAEHTFEWTVDYWGSQERNYKIPWMKWKCKHSLPKTHGVQQKQGWEEVYKNEWLHQKNRFKLN
jgi:hypothetical protein